MTRMFSAVFLFAIVALEGSAYIGQETPQNASEQSFGTSGALYRCRSAHDQERI